MSQIFTLEIDAVNKMVIAVGFANAAGYIYLVVEICVLD
jgi:hypothetical protein